MNTPSRKKRPFWPWLAAGAAVLAAAIVAVVFLTLPRPDSPSAAVQKFLDAVAAGDGQTAASLLGDNPDPGVADAIKNIGAAKSLLGDAVVEKVESWPESEKGDGVSLADVNYSVLVAGKKTEGRMFAVLSDGKVKVQPTSLVGEVTCVAAGGGAPTVAGLEDCTTAVSLFPGTYELVAPEQLDFPYEMEGSTFTLNPGEQLSFSPTESEAKVAELLKNASGPAEEAARTAAQAEVTEGRVDTSYISTDKHPAINLKLADLEPIGEPEYVDGKLTASFGATYEADQWIGSIAQEYMTMAHGKKIVVSFDVAADGALSDPKLSISGFSGWHVP